MDAPVIISTKGPNADPICVLCHAPICQTHDWPQWHKADKFARAGLTHRNCAYAIQLLTHGGLDFLPGEMGSLTKVMRVTTSPEFIKAFADIAISLANKVETQIAAEQTRRQTVEKYRISPTLIHRPAVSHREGD